MTPEQAEAVQELVFAGNEMALILIGLGTPAHPVELTDNTRLKVRQWKTAVKMWDDVKADQSAADPILKDFEKEFGQRMQLIQGRLEVVNQGVAQARSREHAVAVQAAVEIVKTNMTAELRRTDDELVHLAIVLLRDTFRQHGPKAADQPTTVEGGGV